MTRIAGRLSDRFGSRMVIRYGLVVAAAATAVLGVSPGHPVWMVVALAVFDAGCFAAQVANQASVVAIQPARSGALNAAYLTLYYAAGAFGAAMAGMLVERVGWVGLMAAAGVAIAAAGLINISRRVRHAK